MIQPQTHSKFYRDLVFWVGVVATIAYRILIFLNKLPSHFWSDLVWYIGTICFIWYFAHRYNIENKRLEMIKQVGLIEKIDKQKTLSIEDREVLSYTLKSLQSSKAQWNYIVIFVSSGLALLIDVFTRLQAFMK
ncbi:MAG: hypothetical protein WCO55_01915 [Candidatus Falkowbacteria bacterium]